MNILIIVIIISSVLLICGCIGAYFIGLNVSILDKAKTSMTAEGDFGDFSIIGIKEPVVLTLDDNMKINPGSKVTFQSMYLNNDNNYSIICNETPEWSGYSVNTVNN